MEKILDIWQRQRWPSQRRQVSVEHLLTGGTVLAILLLWFIATEVKLFSEVLVPSPAKVMKSFWEIWQNGYKEYSLLRHLSDSMLRLLGSFLLVIVTAVPLGLLSGYNSKVRAVIEPLIEFYRPLPPLAYYTLLVLWMGIDDASKIALLYLAGFAPVYIACVSGVKKIKRDYIDGAYTLGASRQQVFRHVIFPACLPDIFMGMRTAIGVAYTTLVAAEMVAAVTGIGWMVLDASKFLRSDIIFLGIFIMGFTGILLDSVLRFVENKVVYPEFVAKYIKVQQKAYELYKNQPEEAADALAKGLNIDKAEAARQAKELIWLSPQEQLSGAYFGSSTKKGNLAKVLKDTADFLVEQKTLDEAPALDAFAKAVNPQYIENAVK